MKISVLTLFPKIIESYLNESIMKKATEKTQLEFEIVDIRLYSPYRHNQVDEYQFGGGKGMVLMPEPIILALESIKTDKSIVCMTTPQGKVWTQTKAKIFANKYEHIILLCGHYEGFDERIRKYVDVELSIGDFVLTGGELASLVIVDSIVRLLPGVIAVDSHMQESFENNLLDYPVYTKPIDFRGDLVPEVLLSGHHANILKFREEQALINTIKKRPDLINEVTLTESQLKLLKQIKK
ncbi:tRNA (guanosine(37)-N1)-methyltransferase TrmD [Spiroplasma endosymbiont of Labia minor]|uniref:tRNA (guanosine(37)-N1)-methyltransferase TrmD n=1 Tax=Spiroplasma endosymbiont of Labia minor TaxID=3066305 RepID=UPI0030CDC156